MIFGFIQHLQGLESPKMEKIIGPPGKPAEYHFLNAPGTILVANPIQVQF